MSTLESLLQRHGRSYAQESGIELDGSPRSLFQLLCMALLLSAPIRAVVAVRAANSLSAAGWCTAAAMAHSTWQQRTAVLNRSGYARYDEKTSRMLGTAADMVLQRYHGDLRLLREEADREPATERLLLTGFPGIGEVGASIFAREVQAVWPEQYPFADARALRTAAVLGLPQDPQALAALVDGPTAFATLVSALVRCGLAHDEAHVICAG